MPPRTRGSIRSHNHGRSQVSTLPSNPSVPQLAPFIGLPYTSTPSNISSSYQNANISGFPQANMEGARDLPLLPNATENSEVLDAVGE